MLETMIWHSAFSKQVFKFFWKTADCISEGKRPNIINEVTNKEMKRLIEFVSVKIKKKD